MGVEAEGLDGRTEAEAEADEGRLNLKGGGRRGLLAGHTDG